MGKALRILCLMVLVGYMSAGLIKLPSQICKPAKKIGYMIANGVTKCARKYGLPARELQKAKAPAKPVSKPKAKPAPKPKKGGKKTKGKKGGKKGFQERRKERRQKSFQESQGPRQSQDHQKS